MVQTVAVGTDGSGTASKAVDFAIDLAGRYEAKIVFISAYVPVSGARLKREGRDAPEELQWMINPAEDVEATLRECEERAEERGLSWTSEARQARWDSRIAMARGQSSIRRSSPVFVTSR